MATPMMTEAQRAVQLWSLLMLAARTQQVLSYVMVSRLTGVVPPPALSGPLGAIYHYCERHRLPPLTSLVIQEPTGRPSFEAFDNVDIPAAQARVFVFDWLSHGVPSPRDFEEARAAAKG